MDLKRQVLEKSQESLRKVKRRNRRLNNMAFNNEEILTLAKAGFTAQQIAALNMVGTAQASTQLPDGSGVMVAPTQLPDGSGVMVAPIAAPAPTAPAAPTAPTAPTAPAPTAPAPTAPAPTAPAPTATTDDILKAISGLSAQVTTGLIQTTLQPTPATAESILAEIINPPQKTTN